MKKILIIIFIVFLFLGLSGWLFLHIYNYRSEQEQNYNTYSLTKEEIALIKDGDIILRHGFGFVSDAIVQQLKEKYDISHCAIVCKDDTNICVINSISSTLSDVDGVQSQDLKSFIHESQPNSVIIVRYKPKIDKDNSCISRRAKDYLNKKIPFDNAFNIKDSSEFYCSELLWKVFLNEFHDDIFLGKDQKRKDHMKFDIFLDTSRFDIILNHHLRKTVH
jgi:hypothetical protein